MQNLLVQRWLAVAARLCSEAAIGWSRRSRWRRRSAQEDNLLPQHFFLRAAVLVSRRKKQSLVSVKCFICSICLCPALLYARFRHWLLVIQAFAEGCLKFRNMSVTKQRKGTNSPLEERKQQIVMHRLQCQRICFSGRDIVIFLPHETSAISQKRFSGRNLILWEEDELVVRDETQRCFQHSSWLLSFLI